MPTTALVLGKAGVAAVVTPQDSVRGDPWGQRVWHEASITVFGIDGPLGCC